MASSGKTGTVFDNLEQIGSGSGFLGEIADMLERADILRDFSRQEVEVLAASFVAYEAQPGAVVLKEGDKERYMFVLAAGKVDIIKRSDDSDNRKLATVRAGKTVGEMSVIDGLPHSATAVAAEPCTLLLITKRNFEWVTAQNPEVGLKLLNKIAMLMSLRLRQTSGVLIDYLDA